MNYDERLIGRKPSDKHIAESRNRLDAMFKQKFEQRAEQRKRERALKEPELAILRKLGKDDKTIAAAVKEAKEQSAASAKRRLKPPKHVSVKPRQRLGSVAVTFVPPYWPWDWSATTGSATANVSADGNAGTMSFDAWTGDNGKTASTAVALGYYFQPLADNGIMEIFSNPSVSYEMDTWTVFDSAHAGGFIGLYVGSYALNGNFEGAVIDQQIDLSNVAGGSQGSNSGYPLFGWTPVDSDHFYEIWVWAGGDAEADGWSLFWGSAALSYGSLAVPSISVYAY